MRTFDIKKGMRVLLRNGYEGTMIDSKREYLRMVDVPDLKAREGVASRDIMKVLNEQGVWIDVMHNAKEKSMQ